MAALIDSLIPLLQRDAAQLSSLEQILKEERAALESRDNPALQAAVERKAQTVQLIQNNAQEKSRLFAQHGLPVSPQHIKAALAQLKREDVLELWEQVKAQLEHCQSLNEINGRIVSRSQQSVARLMDILRGQDRQQKLYGQNGRDNSMGSTNLLANA